MFGRKPQPKTMVITESTAFKSNRKRLTKKIDKLEREGWEVAHMSTEYLGSLFPETTVMLRRVENV